MFSFFGNSIPKEFRNAEKAARKSDDAFIATFKKSLAKEAKEAKPKYGLFNNLENKIKAKATAETAVVRTKAINKVPVTYAKLRMNLSKQMNEFMEVISNTTFGSESILSEIDSRINKIKKEVDGMGSEMTAIFKEAKAATNTVKANAAAAAAAAPATTGGAKRRRVKKVAKKVSSKKVSSKKVSSKKRTMKKRTMKKRVTKKPTMKKRTMKKRTMKKRTMKKRSTRRA